MLWGSVAGDFDQNRRLWRKKQHQPQKSCWKWVDFDACLHGLGKLKNACRSLRTMTREDFNRFMHDVDKYLPGKASKFWRCAEWPVQ